LPRNENELVGQADELASFATAAGLVPTELAAHDFDLLQSSTGGGVLCTPPPLNGRGCVSSDPSERGIHRGFTKGKEVMKRNLLAGLILALAAPVSAFAADAKHSARVHKPAVVAQADAKSTAKSADTKAKKKAPKAKTSKTTAKSTDQKSNQLK
jgi:hypothetical protein